MQPALSDLLASALTDPTPRLRLIGAMAATLCDKNYAAISVADVVRAARVSKRTFYEHFATREACYLATYEALSNALLERIEQTVESESESPVERRLLAAAQAYLSALQEVPALARSFFLEIQLAGPDALTARRQVHQRFADVLRVLVAKGKREGAEVRALSPDMSVALVGAINELLTVRIEAGRLHELTQLQAAVVELFEAVLRQPSGPIPVRDKPARQPGRPTRERAEARPRRGHGDA
jgi:AcrR family transcriptional regulator